MIYTVITMSSSGQTWMTRTSNGVDLQITANLEVIVSAKSTVIELFFQKMTVLTLLGGNYTTKLMAGNLTLPNWNENGDYLQSYSLDPLNNFSYPLPSTMFSGYYMTVGATYSYLTFPVFVRMLFITLFYLRAKWLAGRFNRYEVILCHIYSTCLTNIFLVFPRLFVYYW